MKLIAQLLARAQEPRSDGCLRDAELGGDLFVRLTSGVELVDATELAAERSQRASDLALVEPRPLRGCDRLGLRELDRIELLALRAPPLLATTIDEQVVHDRDEPRSRVALLAIAIPTAQRALVGVVD